MSARPHRDSDGRAIVDKGAGIWEFKPRAFNIVWGNDRKYWLIPSDIESNQPAELKEVSWLEVTSSIRLEEGKYHITFKISMKPEAFGWKGVTVYLMAKVGRKGEYLHEKLQRLEQYPTDPTVTTVPEDHPLTVEVKKHTNNGEYNDRRLYFGLYEVWSGKWKGGLIIHGATVKKVD